MDEKQFMVDQWYWLSRFKIPVKITSVNEFTCDCENDGIGFVDHFNHNESEPLDLQLIVDSLNESNKSASPKMG